MIRKVLHMVNVSRPTDSVPTKRGVAVEITPGSKEAAPAKKKKAAKKAKKKESKA